MGRPVVLAFDLGERNTGLAILGDNEILESSLLDFHGLEWDMTCAIFRREIDRRLEHYPIDIIVTEGEVWTGEHQKNRSRLIGMIDIVRTYSLDFSVKVIQPREWQFSIIGYRPERRHDSYGINVGQKHAVRCSLVKHYQAISVDVNVILGKDKGGHKADAIGVGLYVQNLTSILQRVTGG